MLDVEAFGEALYGRGHRQGYLRGVGDARMQVMREAGQAWRHRRQAQATPESGEAGAVIVLLPGVRPEAFLRRLQQGQWDRPPSVPMAARPDGRRTPKTRILQVAGPTGVEGGP